MTSVISSQLKVVEIEALQSTHEEADVQLLLHAAHAATQGYQSIVINTDDTDVLVMCLAFHAEIQANLFLKCGTRA